MKHGWQNWLCKHRLIENETENKDPPNQKARGKMGDRERDNWEQKMGREEDKEKTLAEKRL